MNAIDLTGKLPTGETCHVWACGKCRIARPSQQDAETCCLCRVCGESLDGAPSWQHEHTKCRDKRYAEADAARLEKCEKLDEWDGPVFYNDRFFSSLDEAVEDIDCDYADEEDGPEWLHPAVLVAPPAVDAEEILQNVCENAGDADGELYDSLSGVDEFAAACKAFNEANKDVEWYEEDSRRLVRVPKRTEATK